MKPHAYSWVAIVIVCCASPVALADRMTDLWWEANRTPAQRAADERQTIMGLQYQILEQQRPLAWEPPGMTWAQIERAEARREADARARAAARARAPESWPASEPSRIRPASYSSTRTNSTYSPPRPPPDLPKPTTPNSGGTIKRGNTVIIVPPSQAGETTKGTAVTRPPSTPALAALAR